MYALLYGSHAEGVHRRHGAGRVVAVAAAAGAAAGADVKLYYFEVINLIPKFALPSVAIPPKWSYKCANLVIHVHIWCGVRRVGLARVIV